MDANNDNAPLHCLHGDEDNLSVPDDDTTITHQPPVLLSQPLNLCFWHMTIIIIITLFPIIKT